jgi:hypothetical protein
LTVVHCSWQASFKHNPYQEKIPRHWSRTRIIQLWRHQSVESGRVITPLRIGKSHCAASQSVGQNRQPNWICEIGCGLDDDWTAWTCDLEAELPIRQPRALKRENRTKAHGNSIHDAAVFACSAVQTAVASLGSAICRPIRRNSIRLNISWGTSNNANCQT